jgi:hypothetical protein
MKPSPRSPRAPSTSRPKPLDGPTMPRFGGASPCQTPRTGAPCLRPLEQRFCSVEAVSTEFRIATQHGLGIIGV